MVCGAKGDSEGDVVGHVLSTRWYSTVRTLKDYCLIVRVYIMNVYMSSDETI